MAKEELIDALEDLYEEGTLQSEGSFTLSAERAREKLTKYQLQNRHAYLLHLFSAAYLTRPQTFSIKLSGRYSTLEFPGGVLPAENLPDLYSYLLFTPKTPEEWLLHELALGIQGAGIGALGRIRLAIGKREFIFSNYKVESRRLAQARPNTIVVEHKLGLLARLLPFLVSRKSAAQLLTTELCPWGLPGRIVPPGKEYSSTSFSPTTFQLCPMAVTKLENGWLSLGSGDQLGKSFNSWLHLSVRGRSVRENLNLGKEQVNAFLICDHLRFDLSQGKLLKDAAYLEVRRQVLNDLASLREELLENSEAPLSPRQRRILRRQAARSHRTAGRLDRSLEHLHHITHSDSKVATIKHLQGKTEEAVRLVRQTLESPLPPGLEAAKLLDLATYQAFLGLPKALGSWKRACQLTEDQHIERKSHIVGETMERGLPWLLDIGVSLDEAWGILNRASELKKQLGPDHSRQAFSKEMASFLRLKNQELEEALFLAEAALAIRKANGELGNPVSCSALTLKALSQSELGRPEALDTAQSRLRLSESVYGPLHPEVACSLNLLAIVEQARGEAHLMRAREIADRLGVVSQTKTHLVVCFRSWFHTRSKWAATTPLFWARPQLGSSES